MARKIGSNALAPNSALKPFEAFIGEWQITGAHPYLPGVTLHGRASFEWLEGGAFMIVRSEINHSEFPDAVEIFGSDDKTKEFFMLHFDERGVSRKYDVALTKNGFTWRRDEPSFSQRFTLSVEEGGNKMASKGEMSREGAGWEGDLALIYERSTKRF